MKRRSVALTATAGAAVGAVGLAALAVPASATDPKLPSVSPEKLVASVLRSQPPALAGKVTVHNNLGLPPIPATGPASKVLSGGKSTFRVWSDGQGRHRLSIPESGGGVTVVDDGNTVWKWNAAERSVVKYTPMHGESGSEQGARTPAPADAAKRIIDKLRDSSTVAVDGTATVAGRDAYELVLTPKPSERTVLREVRIAVGAEKRIPLRVVVNTNGSNSPAFKAGFTKLNIGPQDPELFQFTPPEGAQVREADKHAREESRKEYGGERLSEFRVVGSGWDTVLVARLPEEVLSEEGSPEGQRSMPSVRALAQRFGEPVSGAWGHGWVVTTEAGSALLTADGHIAAGAVPRQVLVDALGRR